MTSSISCELTFVYENVSASVAEAQHLAFATPTSVTATVDGAALRFQQVHMRRTSAATDNSSTAAASASRSHDRRGTAEVPSVTSVIAVRVRPASAFADVEASPRTAFKTEVEVYKVPLRDIQDTELNLDPINTQQPEKPFSIRLYTAHTETHNDLLVSAMELGSIPYAVIASFYGRLQKQLNSHHNGGSAASTTASVVTDNNDGLVRSRSVSQQKPTSSQARAAGGEASSRYAFLSQVNAARRAPTESSAAAEATHNTNVAVVSQDGEDDGEAEDAKSSVKPVNRYNALLASSGALLNRRPGERTAKSGSPQHPDSATAVSETAKAEKQKRVDDAANTSHTAAEAAALSPASLPPGTVIPTWFPAWDNFAPSSESTMNGPGDTSQTAGASKSGSRYALGVTGGGADPTTGATADEDNVRLTSPLSATASSLGDLNNAHSTNPQPSGAAQSLNWQRELYMLKELRDRTTELEEARLAVDALKAALAAKDAEREAHEAGLIRQFPHLTAAQRALLDFDRLLQPLPEAAADRKSCDDAEKQAHPPPTRSGGNDTQLLIRSAVLELAARSLGPSPQELNVPPLRAVSSQPASPLTGSGVASACASHAVTPLLPRASSRKELEPPPPPDESPLSKSTLLRRSTTHPVLHTHAPLVAPRQQPALRHRKHNEAASIPVAPAPVATSSVASSPAPSSTAPGRMTSTDDSEEGAPSHTPVSSQTSRTSSFVVLPAPLATTSAPHVRPNDALRTHPAPAPLAHAVYPLRDSHTAVGGGGGGGGGAAARLTGHSPTTATAPAAHGAHRTKHPHATASHTESENQLQMPPQPLAGTMPPSEPTFLAEETASHSMAT